MTEGQREIAQARQAQVAGEQAVAAQIAALEAMQASISGSEVFVDSAPNQPDATAVQWIG
jgi:hypothetical protein